MKLSKSLFIAALGLSSACSTRTADVRPVTPPWSADHAPAIFVDGDVTVTAEADGRGRDLIPLLQSGIKDGFTAAGYRVVSDASTKPSLTVHLSLAKVGYAKVGTAAAPWGQGAVVEVFDGMTRVGKATRDFVNWKDRGDGRTMEARVQATGRALAVEVSNKAQVTSAAAAAATAAPSQPGDAKPGALPALPSGPAVAPVAAPPAQ